MNLTIGVLTFHRAENCGSALQAYALTNKISQISKVNCELIDYYPVGQKQLYDIFIKDRMLKSTVKNIRSVINYRYLSDRKKTFKIFAKNNLLISKKKYESARDFININCEYNTIVCGSDQIWNSTIVDFNEMYFLPHISGVKKIAFAPSLGTSSIEDLQKIDGIYEYLKDFCYLSAREKTGVHILNGVVGKTQPVALVPDPSLLLSAADYDQIASKRIKKGEYIFFYSLDFKIDAISFVQKLSLVISLPVVIMFTTDHTYRAFFKGFQISRYNGPHNFLSLIKYAKFVVSTSFHGVAFSIIYRKNFFALASSANGKTHYDSRISTLLSNTKLLERYISCDSAVDNVKNLIVKYDNAAIESLVNFATDELREAILK